MKFGVLALDYDGTIAEHGRLDDDVRAALEEVRAFVFTHAGRPCAPPARTLRAFVEGIGSAPDRAVEGHARRGDFSSWIAEVFGDRPLAEEVRELERRYRRGEVVDIATALVEAVSMRYEVDAGAGGGAG